MVSLSQIWRAPVDLVLPERCPACGAITGEGGSFCGACWRQLHFLAPPWCAACALPFPFEQSEEQLCVNCLNNPPLHDGIRAAVAYNDVSRQVALRLKYGGKIGLARMIASQLARYLPTEREHLVVAPVPLHWTRLWARSFNQSALIAKALAADHGLEYAPDILIRTKRTPSLRGLSPKERKRAVGNAFTIHPKWSKRAKNLKVILIDDVLTTGATSDGCIKALRKAGASWVQLFCWARALRGEALPDGVAQALEA